MYFPTRATANAIDASLTIRPLAAEPTLAVAQVAAVRLNHLLTNYAVVEFTEPGDYYFAGETASVSAIYFPSTMRHLRVGPGVRLLRHSGYSSGAVGLGRLMAFSQTATENEGVIIDGGGTIGRTTATGADSQHTVEFVNADLVDIRDITFFTGTTGKYSINTSGVNRVIARNLHFEGLSTNNGTVSDGLHCHGRHGLIDVDGATGTTNDNMFGIGLDEGPNYQNSIAENFQPGNIDTVRIRNLHVTTCQEPVRFFGLNTFTLNITGGTYTDSTKTITKTGAFSSYRYLAGSTITITGGTGITPGTYTIASKVSDNAITITASAGADAADLTASVITTNNRMKNVLVSGITGSLKAGAFAAAGCDYDTGLTDAVIDYAVFEDISVSGGDAGTGTAMVRISTGGVREVVCRRLRPLGNGTHGHTALTVINTAAGLKRLTIEDCTGELPTASTTAAHLINFDNHAAGAAHTVDLITLRGNSFVVGHASNTSNFLNVGSQTNGATTITRIVGADNRMEAQSGGLNRLCMVNGTTSGIITASLDNTTIKHVAEIAVAGNETGTFGKRTVFRMVGLDIQGSMTGGVRGTCDIIATNVTRDHTGAWVSAAITGNPSFEITPQWGHVVLGYINSSNDFSAIGAATTGNLNVNSLTRYANVMGQGFLPRGYCVHETRIKPCTIVTFSAGTVGTITTKVGSAADADQFTSATGDVNWGAAVAFTTFTVEAPAAFSGQGGTANARTDTSMNSDRTLNINVTNSGTGTWNNLNQGRISISFLWSMYQVAA